LILALALIVMGLIVEYSLLPVHYRNKVAVLEYHDVSENKGVYSITPEQLRKQLEKLKREGMNFLTADQFFSFAKGGKVPDNAVFITFDDGYQSFYTNAMPVLLEMNVPAVVFLITDTLQKNDHTATYLHLEDVQSILANRRPDQPRIDFGCHTRNSHKQVDGKGILAAPQLRSGMLETAEQYHTRVTDDLRQCQAAIQHLYQSVGQVPSVSSAMLAYPYGDFDREALSIYQAAGIQIAFTGEPRLFRPADNVLLVPRIHAGTPSANPTRLLRLIRRGISRPAQFV
jgi:peptidoglycan/xylan/chitin deacetylase (PgdA/CDA1 family)